MNTLIPCIEKWIWRRYLELNYHLAQFLAGNDSYIMSLHRIRLSKSLECTFTPVNAEHIMFDCLRFTEEKRRLSDVSSINMSPHNLDIEVRIV